MRRYILPIAFAAFLTCCSTQNRIENIKKNAITANISPTVENDVPELDMGKVKKDTLKVKDEEGKEILIMKAVKDENGEMVATDVIQAAKVTARFRNVAERNGKVDLSFDITVPKAMQDTKWQLRFYPDLFMLEDSTRLEPVIITGQDYRKAQLRGYQQYEKFLSSIITDSLRFVFAHQLEVFLRRNLPGVYRFRNDTSFVSDEEFASHYGVTEKEAIKHYTNWLLVHRNNRKIAMKDDMYKRYVKVPIVSNGLRLDTVIVNSDNDIIYRYVQTVATRPRLKKADIVLSGEIFEQDKRIYRVPASPPLTFYISSLSSFADDTERYKMKILERKVEANTACYIDFASAESEVDPRLGSNASEIKRIKDNLSSLIENKEFEMDSIVVTASCSPEGEYSYNDRLSLKRSESVSRYFNSYIKDYTDSMRANEGMVMDLAGVRGQNYRSNAIRFISKSNGENWKMLESLVARDSSINAVEKENFAMIMRTPDPDRREAELSRESYYSYLREHIYPRLRTVKFDFHLHRKGMLKDTIHTTVVDSAYMRGVEALRDRDYKTAVTLLRPYQDYNAAVAYCAMDYNASAMAILDKLEPTDKVQYMKAIIYSRQGNDEMAVQCYLNACAKNRSFVSRGNLDPEISALISRYGLNKDDY